MAGFTQAGRRRCACQSAAYHNNIELPFVRWIDELYIKSVLVPLLRQRAGGGLWVECHIKRSFHSPGGWLSGWKNNREISTLRSRWQPYPEVGGKLHFS